MIRSRPELRTRYKFADFLFYTCLLAVPVVAALAAVARHSVGWAVAYLVVASAMTVLVLKYYCTRCPHYTRSDPSLKCIFFWGLPKFFAPRPGPLNALDKAAAFLAPAVVLLFPLYWLLMDLGLLIIYMLSLAGFGAAVYRHECERCIYFECPMNRVPDDVKGAQ